MNSCYEMKEIENRTLNRNQIGRIVWKIWKQERK